MYLLGKIAVNVVHGPTIFILTTSICNDYMSHHPERMMATTLFVDV